MVAWLPPLVIWMVPAIGMLSGLFTVPALALFTASLSLYHTRKRQLLDALRSPNNSHFTIYGLLCAWALLSCIWTVNPTKAFSHWVSLMALCAMAIISYRLLQHWHAKTVSTTEYKTLQTRIGISLIIGIFFSVLFALLEVKTEGLLNHLARTHKPDYLFRVSDLNRGAVILSVMLWPALFFLKRYGKLWQLALLTLTGFTLINLESQSSVLGLVCAILAYLGYTLFKERMFTLVKWASIATIALIPIYFSVFTVDQSLSLLPDIEKGSPVYRLHIWHYTAERATEKPLMGWGFDSSRSLPVDNHRVLDNKHPLPLHPHNSILQIWLELGIIGLLCLSVAIACVLKKIRNSTYHNASSPYILACYCSFFAISLTGFGIWQPWFLATPLFAWMLFISLIKDTPTQHGKTVN